VGYEGALERLLRAGDIASSREQQAATARADGDRPRSIEGFSTLLEQGGDRLCLLASPYAD
jgi:hypothetical protein